MYKMTMTGSEVLVKRAHKLPHVDAWGSDTLTGEFTLDCDLGISPSSPAAKAVYTLYFKDFDKQLKKLGDQRAKMYDQLWKAGAREVEPIRGDIRASLAKTKETYETMEALWQKFSTEDAPKLSDACLKKALKATSAAHMEALKGKKQKTALSSKDNKKERLGILKSMLDAVGVGGAAKVGFFVNPLIGAAILTLGGLKALRDGQRAAWKLSQKLSVEIQTNLAEIKSGLQKAKSEVDGLSSSVDLLKQRKMSLNLQLAEIVMLSKDAAKVIETSAKQVKEGELKTEASKLSKAAKAENDQKASIDKLKSEVGDLATLINAIEKAKSAVDTALKHAVVEQKGWNGLMRRLEKSADDTSTIQGSVSSLLGSLRKLAK